MEDGAQTEDVGHAGPDEGRGEAQGEIVDAGDAASGMTMPYPIPTVGNTKPASGIR